MNRVVAWMLIAVCWFLHGAGMAQETPIADAGSSAVDTTQALGGAALVSALRRGGHVIYFRHTATDFSRNDSAMKGFDDCANQRPLNEQGRRDARAIGQQVRRLALPAGEVLASPMCRTMEHARLAFTQFTQFMHVEARGEVRLAEGGDYAGLKRLLATPVPNGQNRWIVGHGIPFRAVAGAPQLAEGEAVVMRPEGTRWTVIARLAVADWAALPATR